MYIMSIMEKSTKFHQYDDKLIQSSLQLRPLVINRCLKSLNESDKLKIIAAIF